MSDRRQVDALRDALVNGENRHRYFTSPTFKASVDTLAEMLPAWVGGLAAGAEAHDKTMAAAVEAAQWASVRPEVPDLMAALEKSVADAKAARETT